MVIPLRPRKFAILVGFRRNEGYVDVVDPVFDFVSELGGGISMFHLLHINCHELYSIVMLAFVPFKIYYLSTDSCF